MPKVSLKELADKPGVSLSTVSKSLRNGYEIGEEAKKKVLLPAEQVGFRPAFMRSISATRCGETPDVEKLVLNTYEVCRERRISIPDTIKVPCFSNLCTAPFLCPSISRRLKWRNRPTFNC